MHKKEGHEIKITELDRQAAKNLKIIWSKYKKDNKVNQTEFASAIGWSQGNFSQYITCRVPIGMKALRTLSKGLGCQPSDIREEFKTEEAPFREKELADALQVTLKALSKASKELVEIKGDSEIDLISVIEQCKSVLETNAV